MNESELIVCGGRRRAATDQVCCRNTGRRKTPFIFQPGCCCVQTWPTVRSFLNRPPVAACQPVSGEERSCRLCVMFLSLGE